MRFLRSIARRCVVGLLASGLCASGAPGQPDMEGEAPRVYALIVGVGEYAGGQLALAEKNATTVRDAVRASFPGARIDFLVSSNDEGSRPTKDRLREIVHLELPTLERHSLVLVYFAGHGVRIGDPETVDTTELGLVTQGGRATGENPDLPNMLLYSELLSALKRTRMCNFIVYLDCCYAGGENSLQSVHDERALQDLGLKGVVVTAGTRAEKTLLGTFTDALDRYWDEERASCHTPEKMGDRLHELVNIILSEYVDAPEGVSLIHPEVVLGEDTQVCMTTFGRPSCFLFLIPPTTRNSVWFQVDELPEEPFNAAQASTMTEGRFYIRQVARRDMVVRCRDSDVRSVSLTRSDVDRDILIVDFSAPPGRELLLPSDPVALRKASDAAYSLGASDDEAFDVELAYLTRAAGRFIDEKGPAQGILTARLQSRTYDDPRWAILASRGDAGSFVEVAEAEDTFDVVSVLNWMDQPMDALALLNTTERLAFSAESQYLALAHSYVSLRLLGETSAAEAVFERGIELEKALDGSGQYKNDIEFVAWLRVLSEDELRKSVMSVPSRIE